MRQWPEKSFDLLALTFVAGMLDALAYLRGRAFIANMTGNTVLLGIGLLGHHREQELPCILALGGFLAGSAVAALILTRKTAPCHPTADLRAGVALELAAMAPFCVIWSIFSAANAHSLAAFSLLVTGGCALGMQSVAVRRLKISGVVTTFITGTMTTAMVELVSRREHTADIEKGNSLLLVGMFVTYILAAASGALAYGAAYRFACFVPVAGAAWVWFRQRRRSRT